METIDFRSDFLTHASDAMHDAARAARDSRCFGLREDPWQRKLEARLAELLGMEDALVFPTCTMANTVGMLLNAPSGSTVVTQQGAHVLVSEANAGATLGGLWMTAVDASGALPALSSWERALSATADAQRSRVALAVLENTHNRSGGVALPRDYVEEVIGCARPHGVRLHLDGSRLFNAASALDTSPAALAAGFDTVSVSLNKTLGAPVAAALASTAAAIDKALVLRQRLGGGLRPIGAAAAATLAGLSDLGHIGTSHALAGRLAHAVAEFACLVPERVPQQTNIVLVQVTAPWTAAALCERLGQAGILALPTAPDRVRFVTYRGITEAHVDRTIATLREILRKPAA